MDGKPTKHWRLVHIIAHIPPDIGSDIRYDVSYDVKYTLIIFLSILYGIISDIVYKCTIALLTNHLTTSPWILQLWQAGHWVGLPFLQNFLNLGTYHETTEKIGRLPKIF